MKKVMTMMLFGGVLAMAPTLAAHAQDTPREARIEGRAEARAVQSDNQWRYRYHNGRWWYWQPNRTWVYWGGNAWTPYRGGPIVDGGVGRGYYSRNDYRRDYYGRGRGYYRGYGDGYRYRGRGPYEYRSGYRGYYGRPGVYLGPGGPGIRF